LFKGFFAGGSSENVVQIVVNLWWFCGGLVVECMAKLHLFPATKNMPTFWDLFSGRLS